MAQFYTLKHFPNSEQAKKYYAETLANLYSEYINRSEDNDINGMYLKLKRPEPIHPDYLSNWTVTMERMARYYSRAEKVLPKGIEVRHYNA